MTHGQAPCAVTVTSDLMDMTGRTVSTFVEKEVVDISHLATGTYIVRIRIKTVDREQVFYKKIVKIFC